MKKNTTNRVSSLENLLLQRIDKLNKSSIGCDPCKKEAQKIQRKMEEEKINEFKIDSIKRIVDSILQDTNDNQQKN